jgi:hypothetical protein
MAMLVVPLPPLLLDILFTFNIMISLVVIMIAIGTRFAVCHHAAAGLERGLHPRGAGPRP